MSNPISHILCLPSSPMETINKLPQCKAIYFILSDKNKLLYIGKSSNLYNRFISHHRREMIKKSNGSIFYIEVDDKLNLDELEATLIDVFEPEWNGCRIPDEYTNMDSLIHVRLPQEIKTRIKESADENRRSLNAEIAHAIEEYLKSKTSSSAPPHSQIHDPHA